MTPAGDFHRSEPGATRAKRTTSLHGKFNETLEGMRFLLEVTMGDEALAKDPAGELGRILRYWGGNLRHYALEPGDGR